MTFRCSVVAIGTELLLGQIVDTNSSWIGEQLALAGIDSHIQMKVGDNLDRMVDMLRVALDRSDAVIVCGGLGPTQDDITREAIAEVMGVDLVRDVEVEDRIRAMFGQSRPRHAVQQPAPGRPARGGPGAARAARHRARSALSGHRRAGSRRSSTPFPACRSR